MVVGSTRWGLTISASLFRRGSGMGTTPEFGSMVQKGKFSALISALVSALKRVDLPTLGRPTIPQLNPMGCLCRSSRGPQNGRDGRRRPENLRGLYPVSG